MSEPRNFLPRRFLPVLDVLETLTALAVQITLVHRIFPSSFRPDLVYLLLAYKAFTRYPLFVLLLAFGAGAVQDALNSWFYFGANILSNLAVVAAILAIRGSIPGQRRLGPFLLVLAGGALGRNLLFAMITALQGSQNLLPLMVRGSGVALYTALLGGVVLVVLHLVRGRDA